MKSHPLRRAASRMPLVTYALIAITAFVYLLQWIPGLGITDALLYAGIYSNGFAFEPWRLVTSVFAHSPSFPFHIIVNMLSLWVFGRILEDFLGAGRFLVLYLLTGMAGSVAVLFLSDPRQPVLGASGAIFGLVGAYLVIQRRLGGPTAQLLVLVAINLVIGFIPGLSISWQAHVGGLACGLLVGLIMLDTQKPRQKTLQIGLLALVAVVLIVAGISPALVNGLSTGL